MWGSPIGPCQCNMFNVADWITIGTTTDNSMRVIHQEVKGKMKNMWYLSL